MFNDAILRWMVVGIVLVVTLQCLVSMSTALRDRLQGLLVEHVKRQRMEALKRQRVEKIRIPNPEEKEAQASRGEERAA